MILPDYPEPGLRIGGHHISFLVEMEVNQEGWIGKTYWSVLANRAFRQLFPPVLDESVKTTVLRVVRQ